MKFSDKILLCVPAIVVSCNSSDLGGIAIGGVCEEPSDCAADAVCILGYCVEDDYFPEGSPEGDQNGGGGTEVTLESACFQLPIAPYQVTGYKFGDPVGGGHYHAGDDCKGSAGTPIHAVYGGTVKFADKAGTWGGMVTLEHKHPVDDSTFYTIYGHMKPNELSVSQGQTVATGDQVGVLGTKAENGGWPEHLHFSIYTGIYPAKNVLGGWVANLTGYQDPVPWLTDNCPACGCVGSLDDATITDDQLHVSGSLHCDAGIDKWSIAVHDKNVFGQYPNGDADVLFFEVIDLASYGFADSDAPVGLWARGIGGEACLLDDTIATQGGGDCSPNDHTVCQGGDVHFADSCGVPGELVTPCMAPKVCVTVSPSVASCQEVPPDCDGDAIDPGEECDGGDLGGASCISLGWDGGSLACSPACTLDTSACTNGEPVSCGDGEQAGSEQCDGVDLGGESCISLGWDGGQLACSPACSFDTSGCTKDQPNPCPDGNKDPGEQCDGGDLGGESCASQGFSGGSLNCTANCTFDTSECTNEPMCVYSVDPKSPASSYDAPYDCPGGIVMPVSGSLNAQTGKLTVSSPGKPNGYGPGNYRVVVFAPNDKISNQCKSFNTVKASLVLNQQANSLTFPAFDSVLQCGGEAKAYCIQKEDGGNVDHFCSGRLEASYQ